MPRPVSTRKPAPSLTDRAQARAELDRREREEAIRHYRPHDGPQIDFHKSMKRRRFFFGGNRVGKTTAGITEDALVALGKSAEKYIDESWPNDLKALWYRKYAHMQPMVGWIVSTTFEKQREVTQGQVLNWIPKAEIVDISYRAKELIEHILLRNGSRIAFKSAEQGRKAFESASIGWVHVDEEQPLEIFDELEMRVMDQKGWVWGTMTPLIGDIWLAVVDEERWPPELCQYWVASWADNPSLDAEEKRLLAATMSEEDRQARVFGRYAKRAGRVFREYNDLIHLVDPPDSGEPNLDPLDGFPRNWLRIAGLDHGLAAPTSAHRIAFDGEGTGYVVFEHYLAEQTVKYHAEMLLKAGIRRLIADPSTHNRTGPNGERVAEEYRKYGVILERGNPDWRLRTERIKNYLHYDRDMETGVVKVPPRLYIVKGRAPSLVAELKKQRWKVGAKGQTYEDVEGPDHATDDIGYILASRRDPKTLPPRKHVYSRPASNTGY
jgi:phage terminase large subunit-like protein